MKPTSSASRKRRSRIIGLTGGIAAGKSGVAALFREQGAHVVSADELARRVVAPGSPGLAQVVARFGPECLAADGTLDRPRLAARVFSDPAERRALEAILHPLIRAAFLAAVAEARKADPACTIVYDAPLLIEAGAHREVDQVVVVDTPRAVQVTRLMARDGLSREDAERRLGAQIAAEVRLAHADVVLDGTLAPEALRARVREILAVG